jgi:hypothetical protein
MSASVFSDAYIQKACHCTSLKMCTFCKRWLKTSKPPKGTTP